MNAPQLAPVSHCPASRDFAEKFGKRRDNVLQAIDNLLKSLTAQNWAAEFIECFEPHPTIHASKFEPGRTFCHHKSRVSAIERRFGDELGVESEGPTGTGATYLLNFIDEQFLNEPLVRIVFI